MSSASLISKLVPAESVRPQHWMTHAFADVVSLPLAVTMRSTVAKEAQVAADAISARMV